jgi:triacylglycerol lipase
MALNEYTLKHPTVLVHGLGAYRRFGPIDYFYKIPQILKESETRFFIPKLTAWQTVESRALELKEQINKKFPDQKVNLIGHSQGGLECRYLVAKLSYSENVASVTTIGTPNRGSSISAFITNKLAPLEEKISEDSKFKIIRRSFQVYKQYAKLLEDEKIQDDFKQISGVAYFSATSVIGKKYRQTSLPIFWIPHKYLLDFDGDNDGFVSLKSSMWGEHICTYIGDHYGQIGHPLGYTRGLNHIKFFKEIFKTLNSEGM